MLDPMVEVISWVIGMYTWCEEHLAELLWKALLYILVASGAIFWLLVAYEIGQSR